MRLYTPVKPGTVNQPFGVNPEYYSKFHDGFGNPLKGHDGIDFLAVHGTPVFAAHDGQIRFASDSHGGEGMVIRSLEQENGAYANTMYWHLIGNTDPKYPHPFPLDGQEYPVQAGQLIGYADNTGAPYESSGDHLHFGLFHTTSSGAILEQNNGYNGRVDPHPFFTGTFAEDVPKVIQRYTLLISLLKSWVGLLEKK